MIEKEMGAFERCGDEAKLACLFFGSPRVILRCILQISRVYFLVDILVWFTKRRPVAVL
jgi:hypothetical protein